DTGYADPKVVYCFDMDEDGDPDLLSVSNSGDGVAWFENPGDTTSAWTRHTIQLVFTNGQNVWAGDINGDGRIDVAAVSRNDMVSWWENQEIQRNAAFHREEIVDADHQGSVGVAVGDLDGDGRGEIVASSATEGKVTVYERDDANASWSVLADITSSATGVQGIAVADMDRDGDLDVIGAVDSTTDELQYWKDTSGDGSTWSAANTLGTVSAGRGVTVADIDGDGDLDAIAAASSTEDFFWFENDGSDSSWTRTEIVDGVAAYAGASGVAAADIDGDGDVDVLGTATTFNDVLFFENTMGDGSAWSAVTIDADFSGALGVAAGDIDGDGDLDAVAAASTGDDISWWSNTAGDGSAWAETAIATNSAAGVNQVAITDLDGDGDADVIATIGTTGAVRFYENTLGDGSTWAAHDLLTSFLGAHGLALGDLERNGLVGFAATAETDGDVSWMANVGGQFALPTTDVAPGALGNSLQEDVFQLEATHNGLVGENDVELVGLELLFEVLPSGDPMLTAEQQTIIDDIEVWLDDGDDSWSSGSDTLVTTLMTPSTDDDGITTVPFADGDANAQIAQGTSETYFVVLRTTGTYSAAPLDSFRVTHETQASSRGEDATRDTPLRLEGTTDVTAGDFDVNPGGTPSADLRILAITDSLDPAMAGDNVTYTVTVANDGPWAAEAVSVAQTLPSGATLVATSGCTNDPMASPCSLGTIRLGESVMFTVEVTLPGDASGSVTYTATASSSTGDPDAGNNSEDEITSIQEPGSLIIGKSLTATGTTGSFAFKYYVLVNNIGGVAEPTASVVDNLPAQLLTPTWTCSGTGGASCTGSGSGNISETVNLPAGGGVTFVVDGTVTATTGTMTNTATVTGVESTDSFTHTLRLDGLLYADGFESDDLSAWSSSAGGP
ncbi:MAG: FG-GAP-like repeat-containing protein, partial [Acidobacteriota bacterium]